MYKHGKIISKKDKEMRKGRLRDAVKKAMELLWHVVRIQNAHYVQLHYSIMYSLYVLVELIKSKYYVIPLPPRCYIILLSL